jgi:hypothetical protein
MLTKDSDTEDSLICRVNCQSGLANIITQAVLTVVSPSDFTLKEGVSAFSLTIFKFYNGLDFEEVRLVRKAEIQRQR